MKLSLKGKIEQSGTILKVLLLLLLIFVCTLLAIGLWFVCGGSQTTTSLKIMQAMQTLGTFMLPCFFASYLWSKHPIKWLCLDVKIGWKEAALVVVLTICAMPFINLLAWINQQMVLPEFLSDLEQLMKSQEEAAAELTERFIRADNVGLLLLNILVMALLPAFSEELLFRGTLQRLFTESMSNKQATTIAIWVSAIIFSAIHFQFYGFLPRMLMGAFLGYLLVWSRSLWLPIIAHFTNNAMAVILYNFYYMKGQNTDKIDSLGTDSTLWLGIVSGLAVAIGIYLIHRYFSKPLSN